jgi:hypothetical protein
MDKEEKTPPPTTTEAARIEKGIWRIEYKVAHYDGSVKRKEKTEVKFLHRLAYNTRKYRG